MAAATNTVNIQDGSTFLTRQQGGDPDATYPAFSLASPNLNFRPTLFFRVDPNVTQGNVELELKLNGTVVVTEDFGTSQVRTYHEIVDAGIITQANNVLEAEAVSGLGEVRISDIQLMYQAVV